MAFIVQVLIKQKIEKEKSAGTQTKYWEIWRFKRSGQWLREWKKSPYHFKEWDTSCAFYGGHTIWTTHPRCLWSISLLSRSSDEQINEMMHGHEIPLSLNSKNLTSHTKWCYHLFACVMPPLCLLGLLEPINTGAYRIQLQLARHHNCKWLNLIILEKCCTFYNALINAAMQLNLSI